MNKQQILKKFTEKWVFNDAGMNYVETPSEHLEKWLSKVLDDYAMGVIGEDEENRKQQSTEFRTITQQGKIEARNALRKQQRRRM